MSLATLARSLACSAVVDRSPRHVGDTVVERRRHPLQLQLLDERHPRTACTQLHCVDTRRVVARERGGTPFGKYFGAGTALRQISLATGGTPTLKRSGKSRRTR